MSIMIEKVIATILLGGIKMKFYKVLLRTRNKKTVISEKTTWDQAQAGKLVEALRKQMYWWERNTQKFDDDPLEVAVEMEEGY